jgi:hypothetical protein
MMFDRVFKVVEVFGRYGMKFGVLTLLREKISGFDFSIFAKKIFFRIFGFF